MNIPLYKPYWGKKAEQAVIHAMRTGNGVADGPETFVMREKLRKVTDAKFAIPVTSCTHAMETAMAVLGVKSGDEVIVPSFTLASTATAVLVRGGTPVFADIDPVTYCLDPVSVERVITKKTVGIMTVHYAGMAGPQFDDLLALAKKNKLWVVEDAAHCIGSYYKSSLSFRPPSRNLAFEKARWIPDQVRDDRRVVDDGSRIKSGMTNRGKHLGTFGIVGAFSFHGTKNVACGEGGAIVTNNSALSDKMEIYRAIGTDRQAFLQGNVSIYRWVGEGSSFMLSDILAALINIQLDQIDKINKDRHHIASKYSKAFVSYADTLQLPVVPVGMTKPNWHIYAIKFKNKDGRIKFIKQMREKNIEVSTHYVPLHISPMGRKIAGRKTVRLPVTEDVAATLVRLPIFAGMTEKELDYTITTARRILRRFL